MPLVVVLRGARTPCIFLLLQVATDNKPEHCSERTRDPDDRDEQDQVPGELCACMHIRQVLKLPPRQGRSAVKSLAQQDAPALPVAYRVGLPHMTSRIPADSLIGTG